MGKLIYLNHSGFLLELPGAVLVFDYFTDPAGVLSLYEDSEKPFFFFVSHGHYDHWNLEILDFTSRAPRYYFLDNSCKDCAPPDTESVVGAGDQAQFIMVDRDFTHEFSEDIADRTGIRVVRCFGSTDEGVSILVETDNGIVFHSGDLNLWDWEAPGTVDVAMDEAYRFELSRLSSALEGRDLWLAMIPVDLRLATKSFRGAEIFLEYASAQYLVPDHLNGGVQLPRQLAKRLAGTPGMPEVLSLTTPGETAELD